MVPLSTRRVGEPSPLGPGKPQEKNETSPLFLSHNHQQAEQVAAIDSKMNVGTTPAPFGRGAVRVCRRHRSILLVAFARPHSLNSFNDDGT